MDSHAHPSCLSNDFGARWCRCMHYLSIIKWGGCQCQLIHLFTFSTLHFLPNPIADEEGHYKSFVDLYGQCTSEEHRPSLLAAGKAPKKSIGFSPSQQHVNNVGLLVQCEECDKWRLQAQAKLSGSDRPRKISGRYIILHMWCYVFWTWPSRKAEECLCERSQV